MATCSLDGECWEWAKAYLDDCICSRRDQVSFGLGLVSVLSWGVAEIPQIITNYKEKSVEGLSLSFLITWIIGDLFNLFGCILEPATLPTQYYMAVLYTMTTLILAAQTVYYGHIYPEVCNKDSKEYRSEGEKKIEKNNSYFRVKPVTDPDKLSSPIPLPKNSTGGELFYRSARSLSSSHTPTAGSLLAQRMTPPFHSGNLVQEPLLGAYVATQSTSQNRESISTSSSKSLLCLVSALMFIGLFNLKLSADSKFLIGNEKINQGFVIQIGRKLLQANTVSIGESCSEGGSRVGTFLGWAMAFIYMGGRVPQIYLNIRRGNVEGLSPFMFIFALVGNSTYVASILVRSMDWSRIQPNLPWLVDAGGCVLLDTFIVIQFIYFYKQTSEDAEVKHEKQWENGFC
ncbi:probable vacuolar amino acid transporter YPQ1 [Hibiscus syriacus]|uniref:probable vacuolar amino acid transporter YPQ1 n=1 Tax=Hibiscus syriacus TaxID=106335 RepID=UPI0019244022|nr:probable vacuolar amino acid transporter YPQ1 [Hibiscus syriacus]